VHGSHLYRTLATLAFALRVVIELPWQTSGDAYWTVEFVGPYGNAVGARIDRESGAIALPHFSNEFRGPVARVCAGES
jgi:hypothetical protein